MLPQVGDQVKLPNLGFDCTIEEELGDGGQGKAYKASYDGNKVALKWYNNDTATEQQRNIIEKLLKTGAPTEKFLWPIDLAISDQVDNFGYIMDLKSDDYQELFNLINREKKPSFRTLCAIAYNLTVNFNKLHAEGFCYRDINFDNIFYHPQTGDIQICDNDNVGINNKNEAQVWGKDEFMAPEVILREQKPNRHTDLHSLAVILFYIFIFDHPLDGKKENEVNSYDAAATRYLYGKNPVFIYDPDDDSNRPVKGIHKNARKFWNYYPSFLKNLFIKSFTEGLKNPGQRIVESQWKKYIVILRNSIMNCSNCGKQNFYDFAKSEACNNGECWGCGHDLQPRYVIEFDNNDQKSVVLNKNRKLYPHHIEGESYDFSQLCAKVEQHPQKPSVLGLKNLTNSVWSFQNKNGQTGNLNPGETISIKDGLSISFARTTGKIKG